MKNGDDKSSGSAKHFGRTTMTRRGVFRDPPTIEVRPDDSGRSRSSESSHPSSPVWSSRPKGKADGAMMRYCAGRDVRALPMADFALVPYDIWTNLAHVLMLERQSIIPREMAGRLVAALRSVENSFHERTLRLDPAKEDVHMNVEALVAEMAGVDAAGRLHTARSRNDQAATDMRLWLRDTLLDFEIGLLALIEMLLVKAEQWKALVMPGFTHGRPGMISTLGYWAAGHAQALLRDVARARRSFRTADQSPLGSAAGYGTSWPIDRRATASLLGFGEVMLVGVDCVTNRWEAEADAVSTLAFAFNHLSTIAQDLIQFSSPMMAYLALPAAFTTGSSIMPQKMNPDFAEVTRAKAAVIQGNLTGLLSLSKGMISGYNRDTQWSKYLVMDAFGEVELAMDVFARVLQEVKPDRRMMYAACKQGFMNAVEIADYIAREFGVEFRRCYKILGRAVKACEDGGELTLDAVHAEMKQQGVEGVIPDEQWALLCDPLSIVNMRRSDGSPAIEKLEEAIVALREQLTAARRSQHERATRIQRALHTLRKVANELETPEN